MIASFRAEPQTLDSSFLHVIEILQIRKWLQLFISTNDIEPQ